MPVNNRSSARPPATASQNPFSTAAFNHAAVNKNNSQRKMPLLKEAHRPPIRLHPQDGLRCPASAVRHHPNPPKQPTSAINTTRRQKIARAELSRKAECQGVHPDLFSRNVPRNRQRTIGSQPLSRLSSAGSTARSSEAASQTTGRHST